jgi:uncharacterized protein (TIGR03000 family)
MSRTFLSLSAAALLATAFAASPAWAQKGHSGHSGHSSGGARPSGFSSGVRPASGFSGARPAGVSGSYHYYNGSAGRYNNFYRPYYGYRPYFASYLPYYGYGYGYNDYAPYYYASYVPYYGGLGLPSYPLIAGYGGGYAPSVAATQPQGQSERPRDGGAHLQLTVPENAEVIIDGTKTTQTGTSREFTTPQLSPGSRYVYKITVRTMDAKGQVVDDTRDIRFQADDWFRIDFTQPAPSPGPQAAPLPKTTKEE